MTFCSKACPFKCFSKCFFILQFNFPAIEKCSDQTVINQKLPLVDKVLSCHSKLCLQLTKPYQLERIFFWSLIEKKRGDIETYLNHAVPFHFAHRTTLWWAHIWLMDGALIFCNIRSDRSCLAKHRGAYFSVINGRIKDPIAAPRPYVNQEISWHCSSSYFV